MSDAPVNDRVVFRGAYVVANGVLCLSFLLLTALASRVIWRGELSTWRLKLFFGFVLASVIGSRANLNESLGSMFWGTFNFLFFGNTLFRVISNESTTRWCGNPT
jgi:hypothetical protein